MNIGRISNMDKNIVKVLDERLELVGLRLNALRAEQEGLEVEQKSLTGLLNHYHDMDYDSIEEERRVTENILKPEIVKPKAISSSVKRSYVTKYDEMFDTIYMDNDYIGLTSRELADYATSFAEKAIGTDTIGHVMKRFIEKGKAHKEGNLYYWYKED